MLLDQVRRFDPKTEPNWIESAFDLATNRAIALRAVDYRTRLARVGKRYNKMLFL
jgi:hypothetical protein